MSFFGKFPRARSDGDEARSDAASHSESYLHTGANTPPSLYDKAREQFVEIYGSAQVSSARMFLISVGCIVLGLASVASLAFVLPLKTVTGFLVPVNPDGTVNRPVEVQRVDPNTAVIKAELGRWAEAVYAIDPLRSSELLRWANARTADKGVTQFGEFRARERIFERMSREPDMVREVKVTAVDVSQKGTAFVFLTTTERLGAGAPAPDKVKKFRVTLNYRLLPPTQEKDLLANPLGLFVTQFSDVEERAL
jgi:type IV secretory pathway TrbF-like protein